MYKLIGYPKTRAFRVLWMLEEIGADYEIDPVMPRSEECKAFNPSGKVPVLQVGEDNIIDSVAICQFPRRQTWQANLSRRQHCAGKAGQFHAVRHGRHRIAAVVQRQEHLCSA